VVGVYHCWNRFVRQLYLAGVDPITGVDRSARKQWFLQRLRELAEIFLVDVLTHSILSTHFHLILRNRPDLAEAITDEDVVRRWRALYPHRRNADGTPAELAPHEIRLELQDPKQVAEWRRRLADISWFMKCFSEELAKNANAEDGVCGAFFAHRFKCKRLEDEAAVVACSVYIDLNEIRALLAETPEDSRHSSIGHRSQGRRARSRDAIEGATTLGAACLPGVDLNVECARRGDADYWHCPVHEGAAVACLAPHGRAAEFHTDLPPGRRLTRYGFLPVTLDQYLSLVDWSGRQARAGKAGVIPATLAPILERLGVRAEQWCAVTEQFDSWFTYVAGRMEAMLNFAAQAGLAWVHGLPRSRQTFF
jgi:hypothetical protein